MLKEERDRIYLLKWAGWQQLLYSISSAHMQDPQGWTYASGQVETQLSSQPTASSPREAEIRAIHSIAGKSYDV